MGIPCKILVPLTILFSALLLTAQSKCRKSCNLAIASYYIREGSNLTYISKIFNQNIPNILHYNPQIASADNIQTGARINVPFHCECLNHDFLGYTFEYITQPGDTYTKIAHFAFANLTTDYWMQRVNTYDPTQLTDFSPINVTVNCSCGDRHVSRDYGLFATYPLRPGETLESLATDTGLSPDLIRGFNPGANFSAGSGIVFLPAKGEDSSTLSSSDCTLNPNKIFTV